MKMDNSKIDKEGKLKQGVHHEYFKNGSLSCKGSFKEGERIGEWKWYRENGELMQTGSLDNDIKTGVWTRYRPDGKLMDKTEFLNGKKGKITKF